MFEQRGNMGEASSTVRAGEHTGRGRPPMSERRKSLVREQIARAAVTLFTERGVNATTGDDIAEAVGMSTRTLWRYFPTKESCVRPLLTSGLDRMVEHLRSWPRGTSLVEHVEGSGALAADRIEAPVGDLIRMTRREPDIMEIGRASCREE